MWKNWEKAKYKSLMTSLGAEQWKWEGEGEPEKCWTGRVAELGKVLGDGWDIRDWTLLDFTMHLAAPVHRQVQLGGKNKNKSAFNCYIFLLHEKHRCVMAMEGNMKTKDALLMEHRANKTKSTSQVDFVSWLLKGKRKMSKQTGVTITEFDSGSPRRMSLYSEQRKSKV